MQAARTLAAHVNDARFRPRREAFPTGGFTPPVKTPS
jgi:hypothetical protein